VSLTLPARWRPRGAHRDPRTRRDLLAIIRDQKRRLDDADALIKAQENKLLDRGAEYTELRRAHRMLADKLAAANGKLGRESDPEATQEVPLPQPSRVVPLWARSSNAWWDAPGCPAGWAA
jgi:hypothetical protein